MKKRACGMGLDKYRDENVIFDMQIKESGGFSNYRYDVEHILYTFP